VHAGEQLRELAERLRTPLFEPGGVLAELREVQQSQLTHQAQELAEVFQRSSSKVEGRNGVPLAAEPSTSRVRSPEKAYMSDGDSHLFPHACRRHTRGGAVFWSEPTVDVCCDLGTRRDSSCPPQPAATSRELG